MRIQRASTWFAPLLPDPHRKSDARPPAMPVASGTAATAPAASGSESLPPADSGSEP